MYGIFNVIRNGNFFIQYRCSIIFRMRQRIIIYCDVENEHFDRSNKESK
jgi:hypothetical protein